MQRQHGRQSLHSVGRRIAADAQIHDVISQSGRVDRSLQIVRIALPGSSRIRRRGYRRTPRSPDAYRPFVAAVSVGAACSTTTAWVCEACSRFSRLPHAENATASAVEEHQF